MNKDQFIKKPKISVSVIIPFFNSAKYLKECLNSICNQTLKNIEIICINDVEDGNSETRNHLKCLLEEIFPKPASWEKQ